MAIFLFHGADAYGQREKLNFWQKEFEKKYGDMNISVLADKETSAREIFQTCSAVPFLSEKRLTIVKDFLEKTDEENTKDRTLMTGLLEKIPDFCTLVFSEAKPADKRTSLYKKIHKLGKIIEFSAPAGSKLLAWIERKVSELNGRINRDAILHLAELVPDDLFRLENEIFKLVHFAKDKPVSKEDIELLVNTQLSTSIFRLTDAIGQKNKKNSISALHQLIENGEELHRILYMIMRQFRIITCVKDLSAQGLSSSSIGEKLHAHPFVVSNTLPQARNFSLDQLRRAYELLLEMDAKLKSGGIKIFAGDNREFVLALDRLVLKLCA